MRIPSRFIGGPVKQPKGIGRAPGKGPGRVPGKGPGRKRTRIQPVGPMLKKTGKSPARPISSARAPVRRGEDDRGRSPGRLGKMRMK